MSATNYYLGKGFTCLTKTYVMHGAGTVSAWIPRAGTRVVVTSVAVASNLTGTVAFYFDNGNDRIAQYNLPASSTISPVIGAWESTVASGRIFANISGGTTDGTTINLNGFEIPVTAV